MTNLYIGPITLEKTNQTFYDVLVSDTSCAIDGVKIIRKGTAEWTSYMEKKKRTLNDWPPDELDRAIARHSEVEQHYEPVRMQALNFSSIFRYPDRYVPKRVIFDESYGIAAEVSIAGRQIDVFKDANWGHMNRLPQTHKTMPYHFFYDGNLQDALSEFEQKGYRFNLWDGMWGIGNLEDGKKTKSIEHLMPIESVTLEDVLRFAGQPELLSEINIRKNS